MTMSILLDQQSRTVGKLDTSAMRDNDGKQMMHLRKGWLDEANCQWRMAMALTWSAVAHAASGLNDGVGRWTLRMSRLQ
jgi:hypothetical protein